MNYQETKDELEQIFNQLRNTVGELSRLPEAQRPGKEQQFQELIEQANSLIQDIEDNQMMWSPHEKSDASNYLKTAKNRLKAIDSDYKENQNRRDLMRKTNEHALGGSSSDQQETLKDHREIFKQGQNLEMNLLGDLNEGIDGLNNVTSELANQREVEFRVDGNLSELDTDVEKGQGLINKILCQQKKKTIAMWGVLILVLIGLCIFLYFVFK